MSVKNLLLRHISKELQDISALSDYPAPKMGWIYAIRKALGMSATQLAKRLGVSRQRIGDIEKAEVLGATTLKTLSEVAHALDCEFVYFLLPRDSLEATVDAQAKKVAEKKIAHISHSMGLEMQSVTSKERARQVQELAQEFEASKK